MIVAQESKQTNVIQNAGILAYQFFRALETYTHKDVSEVEEPPVSGASDEPDQLYRFEIKESEKEEVTGSDRYMELILEEDRVFSATSPFIQIEHLRKEENKKTLNLISEIPDDFEKHFGLKLSNRLRDLFDGSIDDIEEQDLSFDSLKNFLAFFQSEPNLKYPDLVTSPSGNIVAEWRKDRDHHFGAEFLPNKSVHFVVFVPNLSKPLKIDRISGITNYLTLMELIKFKKVDSWASTNND